MIKEKAIFGIYRLENDLVYTPLIFYRTAERAIKQLKSTAKRFKWTFVKDESLFGGYWVAPTGEYYCIASHDITLGKTEGK